MFCLEPASKKPGSMFCAADVVAIELRAAVTVAQHWLWLRHSGCVQCRVLLSSESETSTTCVLFGASVDEAWFDVLCCGSIRDRAESDRRCCTNLAKTGGALPVSVWTEGGHCLIRDDCGRYAYGGTYVIKTHGHAILMMH